MNEIERVRMRLRSVLKDLREAITEGVNAAEDREDHVEQVFHNIIDAEISVVEAEIE